MTTTERVTCVTGPPDDPARYHVAPADLDLVEVGGEGLVYRARDTSSGRTVALKVLTTVPVSEFDQLAERSSLFGAIRHPNLMSHVEVFLGPALTQQRHDDRLIVDADVDLDVAVPYSVAEWIDGCPLVEAAVRASTRDKLAWVADIATALTVLHNTRSSAAPFGIVHRDVKPSNVRVNKDGHAVLLDFGVARPVDHGDMTVGVGTYLWRAPEVLTGADTPTGVERDTWALGALAHWLLVGEPPQLDGATAARERMVPAASQLGDPDAVSRHLAELLRSAPAQRPTDLARWATQLTRLSRRRRGRTRAARLVAGSLLVTTALLLGASASGIAPDALAGSPTTVTEPTRGPTTGPTPGPTEATGPTAAPTTTIPAASDYLVFANPVTAIRRRNVLVTPPFRRFTRRADDTHEIRFDLRGPAPAEPFFTSEVPLVVDGTAATTKRDPLRQQVRYELKLGGRYWTLKVANVSPTDVDTAVLDDEAAQFFGHLRMTGDQLTTDETVYAEVPAWEAQWPAWSIVQGVTVVSAYEDSTTMISDLPGDQATVRGRPAVAGRFDVVWRESPSRIVVVTAWELPPEQIIDPVAYRGLRLRPAETLTASTADAYRALPSDVDDATMLLVTTPQDHRELVLGFAIERPGAPPGFGREPIGSEGATIGRALATGAEVGDVAIWALAPDAVGVPTSVPPCATRVPLPPAGAPLVVQPLDPACLGTTG